MYHFLSGYTAKVAGTEVGVTEPEATFSACFGAPFLALPPAVYAEHARRSGWSSTARQAWLVNTGWTGGPYGVGHRMPIAETRAMVRAALSGVLDAAPTRTDPVFGLEVPVHVEGVDDALLTRAPRGPTPMPSTARPPNSPRRSRSTSRPTPMRCRPPWRRPVPPAW